MVWSKQGYTFAIVYLILHSLLEECRPYVLVSNFMVSIIKEKIGSHVACLIEGGGGRGSKAKPPIVLDHLPQDTPPTRMTYFSPANMNVEKVRWRPDIGGCKSGRREREVAKRATDHTKHKTREVYIERLDKRQGGRR